MPDAAQHQIQSAIIKGVPKAFLLDMYDRARKAYAEMYHQVAADKSVLPEHKLAKLKADRQFRMEWEFQQSATKLGLAVTTHAIDENTWAYVYAKTQGIGITQSYVQRHDAIPHEAKFRQQLAAESVLPRLDLHDDNPELFEPCRFYALLSHTPVADEFTEQKQMLGSMQLCVPDGEMKTWRMRKSVVELASLYPAATKPRVANRDPVMKPAIHKKKRGTE